MGSSKRHRSKKFGMPPGTLMHIGEMKIEKPVMSLFLYNENSLIEKDVQSVSEIPTQNPGEVLWLNLHGIHDPSLIEAIGKRFSVHPLILEDILNTHQRPKAEQYPNVLFVTTRLFYYDSTIRALGSDQVSIILGESFILSFQEKPTGTFNALRDRLRAGSGRIRQAGADYLAYSLLDASVDVYFNLIETFADYGDSLEERRMNNDEPHLLTDIHRAKRNVSELHRAIWSTREMLAILQRGDVQGFAVNTRLYLRDVYDHSVHLLESLDALRDLLTGVQESFLSSISNRVNIEVRTLTVVTTLLMPASLIAGIFGMNFEQMPWLKSSAGFWVILVVMMLIASAMFVWFKRRQMLR